MSLLPRLKAKTINGNTEVKFGTGFVGNSLANVSKKLSEADTIRTISS